MYVIYDEKKSKMHRSREREHMYKKESNDAYH
jgi:hypothetical protein